MKKIIAISIITIALSSCSPKAAKEQTIKSTRTETTVTLTDAQIKNAGIETGKAEIKNLSSILKVNGTIDVPPQNLISVSFPLGGFLKSTDLLPGMKISKGQVIAVMQNEIFIQMQQDYLMAVSKSAYLQKEYDRQKGLNLTKATSDKVFEQTQAEYQQQKITVTALREKLQLLGVNVNDLNDGNISRSVNITSPINGYVSAVNVNVGKYVNATDVLFELVNPTDLHLALTVFEKDLPLIQTGLKVKACHTNGAGKTYTAETILTGKKLDDNRSTIVHCHFIGSTDDLLPGMYLNAEIELPEQPCYTVPEAAIIRAGAKEYIMIEKGNNTFEMADVDVRITQDGYSQINTNKTDLAKERLITKNAYAAFMKLMNRKEE
jgi:cobalt-zinc-cadmium efflux system membrane fusion protein